MENIKITWRHWQNKLSNIGSYMLCYNRGKNFIDTLILRFVYVILPLTLISDILYIVYHFFY